MSLLRYPSPATPFTSQVSTKGKPPAGCLEFVLNHSMVIVFAAVDSDLMSDPAFRMKYAMAIVKEYVAMMLRKIATAGKIGPLPASEAKIVSKDECRG